MSTRIRKQITYGLGFLLAAGGIVWLIAAAIRQPTPPAATPTPTALFQAVVLEEGSLIQHEPASPGANFTSDIVIRLRNPNPRAGVGDYPVIARLLDGAGRVLREETIPTYLLPGAIQYAVRINVPSAGPVARLEAKLPTAPDFSTVPASVALPQFSVVQRQRETKTVGTTVLEEQKWIVRNESPLDWQFVEVTGIAQDAAGKTIGVGQTFVGALTVGEAREFTLQWPATPAPAARVLVLPTTNIYKEENIIRAIGDPNLLR